MARRFEIAAGDAAKYWQIALDGKKVNLRWSSDGGEQTQVKKYATADDAEMEHDRLIRDRLGKGWREVKAREVKARAAAPAATEKPAANAELVAQRQATAKRIGGAGLAHRLPELSPLFRGSIRLTPSAAKKIAVGASQIGGAPSLPEGTKWPMRGAQAMAFLAQIRLDEIAPLDDEKLLPASGLVSFFLAGDTIKVFHHSVNDLVTVDPPGKAKASRAFRVAATSELTLPPPHGHHLEALQLNDDERARWDKKIALKKSGTFHRMLGHPDLDRAPQFDADTILLLQLDSDGKIGLRFGDGERLCIYIGREALAARAFGKAFCAIGE
jgi:predicted DNA-binding WGR domain protein